MKSHRVPLISRRKSLAWIGAGASLLLHGSALALEPEVPIRLQVSLLDRVIPFDRNFSKRVHGQLSVVVVVGASDPDSVRVGAQVLAELAARESLGNFRAVGARVDFTGPQALAEDCKRLRAGVVYFTPGLAAPVPRLAGAMQGLRVMTMGALPEHVPQGLILGCAARSGKPRVLVNLGQARQQEVDFRADFLRMAEVVG